MENNRTILAIALIILVWSGYNLLFPPQQPAQPETQQAVAEQPTSQSEQPVKDVEPVKDFSEQVPLVAPVDERVYRVESDRYLFQLTSRGAVLQSAVLKSYKQENQPDSPPVDILEFSGQALPTFRVSGKEGLYLPADLAYVLRDGQNEYGLAPGEELTLDLVGRTTGGLEVYRSYTFYGDSYQVDQKIKLINRSEQQLHGTVDFSLINIWNEERGGDRYNFIGPSTLVGEEVMEDDPEDLQTSSKLYSKSLLWSGFVDKYFATLASPQNGASKKVQIEMGEGFVENRFSSDDLTLEPNESISFEYVTYLGPKDYDILLGIGHQFDRAVDLGFFSIIGRPLMIVLKFFHNYLANWGLAIILLTVCIKAIFWPLTQKSYTSMQAMQKLQPQMTKLREKYSSDKQRLNQEMMSLYKENRVNPFGGCLPILIQIPVFFALYQVLLNSIELRHAPFMLWITDLSAKDPYYVTPLIMGATMFLQQKMTPTNMDPTQARIMLMMPVVFTFLFLNFPSGLVIYWLVNNVLTIAQQYLIKRKAAA